jgi:hypothetical protein
MINRFNFPFIRKETLPVYQKNIDKSVILSSDSECKENIIIGQEWSA